MVTIMPQETDNRLAGKTLCWSRAKQKGTVDRLGPLFPWLVPSPRYFAKLEPYCSGWSAEVAGAVVLKRITPDSSEKK